MLFNGEFIRILQDVTYLGHNYNKATKLKGKEELRTYSVTKNSRTNVIRINLVKTYFIECSICVFQSYMYKSGVCLFTEPIFTRSHQNFSPSHGLSRMIHSAQLYVIHVGIISRPESLLGHIDNYVYLE